MRRLRILFLAFGCLFIAREPFAAVNQVDGQVIPYQECPGMYGCIQTGLNFGEGMNPPDSVPAGLNAVLDANTGPETFLVPLTNGEFNTVYFHLIQEGAGFENIFGWYNAGEPNVRYPVIFSCRDGNQSLYEPAWWTDETEVWMDDGFKAQINFQHEFLAGRYHGLQIGFYLVAPKSESDDPGTNCAVDDKDQGVLTSSQPPWTTSGPIDDDNSGDAVDYNPFARVYFTENKLNNDGNYVHYLIYQSKQNPNNFYFGFEDLFRGGDNDYEDTMVKVEGLVPTCQPEQEICNGVDDNCNDDVDENVFQPCATACGEGLERCVFTNDGIVSNNWVECTAPQPGVETCNGIDDDCDGVVDNNLPLGSVCSENGCIGQYICVNGGWVCNAPIPSPEVCDGKDNDCNNKIDDGLSRGCTNSCGIGVEQCFFTNDNDPSNDWANCDAPQPQTESCNNFDDDCDGTIDNNIPPGGSCSANGCTGELICKAGNWECDVAGPSQEVCDGKDNNCNNVIDEGLTRSCSNDCGLGQETCQFTADGNPDNDWINCTAPQPQPEVCNNQDDDCNGIIDDGMPAGPECNLGACLGFMQCMGGKYICDATPPTLELCDGRDNDCDGDIDEGLARSCISSCGFGTELCNFSDDGDPDNDWYGCTAPVPEEEVCDGVDNDCNGMVDDNVPGEGVPCNDPTAETCNDGQTKCVGGEIVCVGATIGSAEICDCKDNDCDGEIDEDNPCAEGSQCIDCGCRIPCSGVEFGCPQGFICKNEFCIPDKCANIVCGPGEKCLDGFCVDPCADVECSNDKVCRDGQCVENNCYGLGCSDGQVCLNTTCQADPCLNVKCSSGEYCNRGECKPSCGKVFCGANMKCLDGICVYNPCLGVSCSMNVPCDDGKCDESCATVACGPGRFCRLGNCFDDLCTGVKCFGGGEFCQDGQCITTNTFSGERSEILATGGGGFSCNISQRSNLNDVPFFLLLTLIALLPLRPRKR